MNHASIGAGFYIRLAALGVVTYLIHEAAHWLVGAALGYPVRFGLNNVTSAVPMAASDAMMMSAAGPAVTVLGALIAFFWSRRTASLTAYAIVFFALFMRFAAAFVSIFNPNDEARISAGLGWGTWTLPTIVVVGLATLTIVASRSLRLSWKVNVGAYLVSSIVTAVIVGLDMVLQP